MNVLASRETDGSAHRSEGASAEQALSEQLGASRAAASVLAQASAEQRDHALREAARALRSATDAILAANAADLDGFSGTDAFRDRLALNGARVEAMAAGLEQVAMLPDPLGRVLAEWTRPNGLAIRRVSVPLGVLGMIYESRPNVGADAAGLAIKSGNALILRGGSESFHSAGAIGQAVASGLQAGGLPREAVQSSPTTDRAYVAAMLGATGGIDLLIPRGGRSLVERVEREARVPVLSHAAGLCHTYVHASADPEMAIRILLDAKMRRTGICGATETLLIDGEVAPVLLPRIAGALQALGCRLRTDARAHAILPDTEAADADTFDTEWLDAVLSVGVVDGVEAALAHVRAHGSRHTDAIVAEDAEAARRFLAGTDGAVVMWNASTQFCDGGEFGFGAEIGISTGRLHARGPVGLEQLTSYRYEVLGQGQVRG